MERISYVLFAFDGRINRIAWLICFAALAIAESVLGAFLREMYGIQAPAGTGSAAEVYFGDPAAFLAGLIFLWPSLAVDVKRWHDIGRSGWLTLIAYGPVLAVYLVEKLKAADAIADTPLPPTLISLIGLVFLVYIILLAARRGSPSANRFGPAL
ncbi:MAG: DUF805 domain-containing protein [Rhodomicrobium sp.]